MKNKFGKMIFISMIIVILMSLIMINTSFASGIEDPIENPDAYHPGTNWGSNNTRLTEIGEIIFSAIRIIGTIIAVVALMTIGLKYMFGSVEDKASYKERLVPYIIGAVMLFAITTILQIVYELVTGIHYNG